MQLSATKIFGIVQSLKLCVFVFSVFSCQYLGAEAQDILPISIHVSKYGEGDSIGKVLLEIKNNTTSELLIPTEYLLDGRVLLSVEDLKAKKGLQTSISFFASKIANSPFEASNSPPNEIPAESFKIAPNSSVRFKLDLSKQLERVRRQFPEGPIGLRLDFTQSFMNIEQLKGLVGLKVRSNNFAFEHAASP